jgi:hypothetical protein
MTHLRTADFLTHGTQYCSIKHQLMLCMLSRAALCGDVLQVMFEPSMRHAGMLLSMDWQAAVVSAFVDIMHRPAALQPALQQAMGPAAHDLTAANTSAVDTAADLAAADVTVRVTTAPAAAGKALSGIACSMTDTAAAPDRTAAAAEPDAAQTHQHTVARLCEQPFSDVTAISAAGDVGSPKHCSHPSGRMCCGCMSGCADTYLQEDCGLRRARSSPLQHRPHSRRQQQQRQQQSVGAWSGTCEAAVGVGGCRAAVDGVKAALVSSPSKAAAQVAA